MVFLAPEVAGAAEAAGEAKAARGAGAAAKRGPGRPGTVAHQRAAIEHLKASRPKPTEAPAEDTPPPPPAATATEPKPARVLTSMDPVHTGSGFVLGTLAWVVFMNYLRGGMPQVRRWGAAKFLNKVTPTGGTK